MGILSVCSNVDKANGLVDRYLPGPGAGWMAWNDYSMMILTILLYNIAITGTALMRLKPWGVFRINRISYRLTRDKRLTYVINPIFHVYLDPRSH